MTRELALRKVEPRGGASNGQRLRCLQRTCQDSVKRRCSRGTAALARRESSRSLVPRSLVRAMAVESAISLDVGQLIRMFGELPKARSENDLFKGVYSSTKEAVARQEKYERKLGRLTTENELLTRRLEVVSLKLRDLERQLIYERTFYQEQKSCYLNAMKTRIETRHVKTQTYAVDFTYDSDQVTSLVSELRAVRELYLKQKALTTTVCEKYVKMRDNKESVIRRMTRLEEQYQDTIQEAMTNFDRDRVAFALLEKDGVLPKDLHADLAVRCSKLSFNNAALHAALLKIKSDRLRRSSKDFMGDVSIFSILKDTKDLAMVDSKLKKTKRWKSTEKRNEERGNQVLGKFVSLPILVNEGGRSSCKITPLFEVENDEDASDEEEEGDSNGEIEEVEVDCSFRKGRRKRRVWFSNSSITRSRESNCYSTRSQESLSCSVESSTTIGDSSSKEQAGFCDKKTAKCESQVDFKEISPRPPRTGSAPDIIQATF